MGLFFVSFLYSSSKKASSKKVMLFFTSSSKSISNLCNGMRFCFAFWCSAPKSGLSLVAMADGDAVDRAGLYEGERDRCDAS